MVLEVSELFTKLKLKNYKSLVDIEFDLTKNKKPKNIILIYGENGAGKSNIASAFFTLSDIIETLSVKERLQNFLEDKNIDKLDENEKIELLNVLKRNLKDTETIIKECKTIDSDENMLLEYEFELNDKKGKYTIEMNDEEIVKEELKYVIDKNIGSYFNIESDKKINLNNTIFKEKKYQEELKEKIEKFWGKHSFLSIINNDKNNYNKEYFKDKLSENLLDVLMFIKGLTCRINIGDSEERGKYRVSNKIFPNLLNGKIKKEEEEELVLVEDFLNEIYTNLYSDIKNIYYDKKIEGEEIEYRLFSQKMIGGSIRNIDFGLESTGTLNILNLIPSLYEAVRGRVVILDEFDSGIHDIMVRNLLTSVNEYINGQLIITTHNTLLMESDIDSDSIYFISIDELGNKEILCLNDYEKRTHPNHNRRDLYLRGIYNAIPLVRELDFDELEDILSKE
ncbi:AAA family ATPase [Clostridium perfringens]|uniref:AAA family ATPase n=1 Tax=Clostridium perfringens TaxID=1502 RepID=UPI0028CE92A6|nr:AAA family ATPase [Clostridium perfringens]MDT7914698.1 AAA family ATPase [Clostridium perfringens]